MDAEGAIRLAAQIVSRTGAASSMEEAAQLATSFLRSELVDDDGAPACPLVRVYKTHRLGDLDDDVIAFARSAAVGTDPVVDDTTCLVLLGTSGAEDGWNDRRRSCGHRAIPLSSPSAIRRMPMISHLLRDFGLDTAAVSDPTARLDTTLSGGRLGVFHVPYAEGSITIPAQADFVEPFGIRSALGVGAVIGSRDVVAVVMFTNVRVSSGVAEHCAALAEGVHQAFEPLVDRPFDQSRS
jgi:hypothetical protein